MSWFASTTPTGPVIHPVQARFSPELLFGKLEKEDTEWLCAGGFVTETQVFYATTATGGLVMCQVIHSSLGLWYPSIQFTFRYVEPSKSIHIWKSTTVTNFITSPPSKSTTTTPLDKRSCKSDQFTITLNPDSPNKYLIEGKYDDEIQISLVYEKLAEGWKLGSGPQGGMTYFGALSNSNSSSTTAEPDIKAGADGYAIHRFWPRCEVSGIMRIGKDVIDLAGSRGTFIHAIQGLRPNVLAAGWNFANFQSSKEGGEGVALTMMEFVTTPAYGGVKITVGSIVVGDKLVAITAGGEGIVESDTSTKAKHLNSTIDVETDYKAPGSILYEWEGATLFNDSNVGSNSNKSKAKLNIDLITSQPGEIYTTKGLVEKVDVLGEVPYLAKKFVNYAAGTKPYIYTWLNDSEATITIPSDLSDTSSTLKTLQVKGTLFNEATFIS